MVNLEGALAVGISRVVNLGFLVCLMGGVCGRSRGGGVGVVGVWLTQAGDIASL